MNNRQRNSVKLHLGRDMERTRRIKLSDEELEDIIKKYSSDINYQLEVGSTTKEIGWMISDHWWQHEGRQEKKAMKLTPDTTDIRRSANRTAAPMYALVDPNGRPVKVEDWYDFEPLWKLDLISPNREILEGILSNRDMEIGEVEGYQVIPLQ